MFLKSTVSHAATCAATAAFGPRGFDFRAASSISKVEEVEHAIATAASLGTVDAFPSPLTQETRDNVRVDGFSTGALPPWDALLILVGRWEVGAPALDACKCTSLVPAADAPFFCASRPNALRVLVEEVARTARRVIRIGHRRGRRRLCRGLGAGRALASLRRTLARALARALTAGHQGQQG